MSNRSNKYYKLEDYLANSHETVLRMSFSEMEDILGFKLNDSAYKHPTIWSNSDSHSMALAWLNSGYRSEQLSIKGETIVFRKSDNLQVRHTMTRPYKASLRNPTMSTEVAIQLIQDYHNETVKDEHGRYMSWRHCYNEFCKNKNTTSAGAVDYLALHLAFYLASWGMYRGSSFLLQKDYKVHVPVVRIIQEQKYNLLFGISAEGLCKDSSLMLLDDIGNRIKECYANETSSFDGRVNNATDTLVSKILLGTFGCVPAYDRYYVKSVKKNNISSGLYNKDSIYSVAEFYCNHLDAFEELRYELNKCGAEYTPMKLMDMCFWQDAYIDDLRRRSNSTNDNNM